MPRTLARAAVLALIVVLALLPLPAHARSALDVAFDVADGRVTVTGTLTDGEEPLRRRVVVASLDGARQAEAETQGNGGFTLRFDLPSDLAAGTHEVAVEFAGDGDVQPARAVGAITVEGKATGQKPPSSSPTPPRRTESATPTASARPDPTPPDPTTTVLTATGPAESVNSGLLTLTGTLTDPAGRGIVDAGISLTDAGGEVDDSYTLTTAGGAFTTFYAVPEAQPSGRMTLTLTFTGADGLKPSRTTLTVVIEHTEVASPSPSPSESPSPSTTPSPSPTADRGTPSPGASTPATTAVQPPAPAAVTWFLLASAVAGGGALLTAAVLVFRGVNARGDGDEERSLSFLDED